MGHKSVQRHGDHNNITGQEVSPETGLFSVSVTNVGRVFREGRKQTMLDSAGPQRNFRGSNGYKRFGPFGGKLFFYCSGLVGILKKQEVHVVTV